MLNKYLVVFSIAALILSNTIRADGKEVSDNSFKELLRCMEAVPLDAEKYKGIGSQQIILLSVLENITNTSASINELNINYSEIYKLVQNNCPKELEVVKKLSVQKQG
jgi:hypothetical protein